MTLMLRMRLCVNRLPIEGIGTRHNSIRRLFRYGVDQDPIGFMDQADRARLTNGGIVRIEAIMPLCVHSFINGEIDQVVIRSLKVFKDARGWLVELFRQDELVEDRWPRMTYVSQTLPGVTRGPHEHVLQTDGFAFIGPSDFKLFLWDTRPESPTVGRRTVVLVGESNPVAVWIPPGVVHAYRNMGTLPGLVFNSPNRLFAGQGKKEPIDEIRHEENEPSRFRMD
jgi:dTDP-4-dehydrorhamnose 3,5-epimerase